MEASENLAKSKHRTRNKSETNFSRFIGPGKYMLPSEVPTNRAVLQMGILLREKKIIEEGIDTRKYDFKQVCKDLAPLVIELWLKSNKKFKPPVILQERGVRKRIEKVWAKAERIASGKYKKGEKVDMESSLDRLMDITVCKHQIFLCETEESGCKIPGGCKTKAHILCDCPFNQKIPVLELAWVYCQRNKIGEKSVMQMGLNDIKETKRQTKAEKREIKEAESAEKRFKKQKLEKEELIERTNDFENLATNDEEVSPHDEREDEPRCSGQITTVEKREVWRLVDIILNENLGKFAYLVTRFLEKPSLKQNTMPIHNTARSSLR